MEKYSSCIILLNETKKILGTFSKRNSFIYWKIFPFLTMTFYYGFIQVKFSQAAQNDFAQTESVTHSLHKHLVIARCILASSDLARTQVWNLSFSANDYTIPDNSPQNWEFSCTICHQNPVYNLISAACKKGRINILLVDTIITKIVGNKKKNISLLLLLLS